MIYEIFRRLIKLQYSELLNTAAVFDPDRLQAGFNELFKHLSIFFFFFMYLMQ